MSRRKTEKSLAVVAVVFACTAAVGQAADPGGAGYGITTRPAAGPGGTLVVRGAVLLGRSLHVKGTMTSAAAGRSVLVERQLRDGSWAATAKATTQAGGKFTAIWKTNHIGKFAMRALEIAPQRSAPTGASAVTVYKPAFATYFGHGFYGQQMACGAVLRHTTLGVAHRTLPCGTIVDLYYKGRSIAVPVVDRGPYRKGTTWDLTEATASALRMTSSSKIGAVRAPGGKQAG